MLKKRIIPCLDVKDGKTVKGINFKSLRYAGDPVEMASIYADQGADELVFLDITATLEKRALFYTLIREVASQVNIPFTVGGGIKTISDVENLLLAGADKVSINSAAINDKKLISSLANRFGSQCITIAIDIKKVEDNWVVFKSGGTIKTELKAVEWARQVQEMGAGEILLTVMDNDGTKSGFSIEISKAIDDQLSIPVIASGGAGKAAHFHDLFRLSNISAGLAASIFHFGELTIPDLKKELFENKIPVRL